ncbi:hypothetical protein NIES3585_32570 [Nodularia sp. NIES-3585]|nr:hypothetical protein NIES3585_32570 [Nodularia sp. NIES-3585]
MQRLYEVLNSFVCFIYLKIAVNTKTTGIFLGAVKLINMVRCAMRQHTLLRIVVNLTTLIFRFFLIPLCLL